MSTTSSRAGKAADDTPDEPVRLEGNYSSYAEGAEVDTEAEVNEGVTDVGVEPEPEKKAAAKDVADEPEPKGRKS